MNGDVGSDADKLQLDMFGTSAQMTHTFTLETLC